jgi:hypothetical protein
MSMASRQTEEQVVAQLEQLGVRYLSRQAHVDPTPARPTHDLLADLVHQPSSRVRTALIALLLAHPDYCAAIPAAIQQLTPSEVLTLKTFYTAAVLLQRQYADRLQEFLGSEWRWLPDLFSDELGVEGDTPLARLHSLGRIHTRWSGVQLNWAGTYENASRLLVRRWELEQAWKQ